VKKDVVVALAGVVAILMICFGVASMRASFPPIQSHPFVSGNAAASAWGDSPVVMRVNGEAVTKKEFEIYVAGAPEQMREFATTPEGRKLIADQVVAMKTLDQQGRKLGVESDPESASQLALGRSSVSANFALQKLIGTPTDAELHAAYVKEQSTSNARQVSHILVSCGDSPIPSRTGTNFPCDAAMKKAGQIAAAIHSPQDFQRAAQALSDDTNSGAQGGLLGALRPGSMPPDVERVVFSLPSNQASAPLKTQFGYHIFMVSAAEPEPFAKVRPMLEQKWKQEKMKAVMAASRKNAKVELDPKYFAAGAPGALTMPPMKRGR